MTRQSSVSLSTPISNLYMVGPTYVKRLKKLEIDTVGDLLSHFPHRYNDFSLISKIGQLQTGETATIQGQILSIVNTITKSGKRIQRAVVGDKTGEISVVWFNQPFLVQTLRQGCVVNLSGKVDFFGRERVLSSPEYEIIRPSGKKNKPSIHTGRLVPVYPETYGVSSKWLRSRIYPLLAFKDEIKEFLPTDIIRKNKFLSLYDAIRQMHFPTNIDLAEKARMRLAFDELFLMQLASQVKKTARKKERVNCTVKINKYQDKIDKFIKKLPFKLTSAQKRAVEDLLSDLCENNPMNRILEGDVGSGKTVVAVIAMYAVALNGAKSLLMCPTEILACQHFETIKKMLAGLNVKVVLHTQNYKTKKSELAGVDIIIGTHALLNLTSALENIGYVVVDEQHRFGVKQREKLRQIGISPHFLAMSATPIPRTIALTLYGDLDLSILDEMPKGRKRVKTWAVPPKKRNAAYSWLKKQIKKMKAQIFIVCPLIEESESLGDVKAVTVEFERLKKEVFSDFKLELLHGKIKAGVKDKIINDFSKGKIDILVTTPVVEVGLDIPGATVMMIEGAERFGLATLHQLRGRVGRRKKESYCLAFTDSVSEKTIQRLAALETTYTGMKLAEIDLKLRGPGEIFGTRQHGIPNLKVASFSDIGLINKTKNEAESIFGKDPTLTSHPNLRAELEKYIINSRLD